MKSPWPTKKLGEICEESKERNLFNKDLPVYTVSHIYGLIPYQLIFYKRVHSLDTSNYKIVKRYEFAFGLPTKNTFPFGFLEDKEYVLVSPAYTVIRIKNDQILNFKFLFYLLKTKKYEQTIIEIAKSSSATRHGFPLRFSHLLNIEIPLPPLSVQQKIVYVLDSIQEAVKVQEKIIDLTKELKKSLMAELFKYGAPSFRKGRKLKKTEIGEIPEDWEVVRLGEVSERPQYGLTASAIEENTGIKLLRITDIQEEKVNWETVPFCNCTNYDFEKYKLITGDILIARIGATTGKTFFIKNPPSAVFGSYLIRIRPKMLLEADFLRYYFQLDLYWQQINLAKGGRLKGGINIPVIENLKISLPPLPEQREIADILQTIDQKIEIEQKKKELYEELFKTMLNKLMKGEVNVNNLEI
jgi:type I restriction enzyme S subunit